MAWYAAIGIEFRRNRELIHSKDYAKERRNTPKSRENINVFMGEIVNGELCSLPKGSTGLCLEQNPNLGIHSVLIMKATVERKKSR